MQEFLVCAVHHWYKGTFKLFFSRTFFFNLRNYSAKNSLQNIKRWIETCLWLDFSIKCLDPCHSYWMKSIKIKKVTMINVFFKLSWNKKCWHWTILVYILVFVDEKCTIKTVNTETVCVFFTAFLSVSSPYCGAGSFYQLFPAVLWVTAAGSGLPLDAAELTVTELCSSLLHSSLPLLSFSRCPLLLLSIALSSSLSAA